MINILIGAALGFIPLILAGIYGYGKAIQKLEAMPDAMRTAMKLEIMEALEQHVIQYRHEERENTSSRIQVPPAQEATP